MNGDVREGAPVLLMDDVSFFYAGERSGAGVAGISLSLCAGELALLCGRSGCGKTTVTRLANGLAPHFYEGTAAGSVRVCGLDVARAELWETARLVGSVFQNPKSQFYNVDVRGEVAFGCENLGFDPADIERRVDDAVRAFDLAPLLDASIFSLSGGQKQRVACAGATATSPRLIVLDEPSSNLDFETIARLRAAIVRWKESGAAVLVAEHRIHYLDDLADQVIYLDEGRIAHRWSGKEFARLDDAERVRLGLRARSVADALRFPERKKPVSPVPSRPDDAPANPSPRKAAKPEKPPIHFENLTAEHRKNGAFVSALDVPSLELPRNSVTALVGPCGAGKS
ncbi:MAG TPA: ATP-binding cassette domain-containing protein, partial [Candidatus Aveggerthella excrementigallinarum]|nr:ATP-binding cassette domain-containing protein [Candidatus Aveggerthella excrementigallinarum]